MKKIIKASLLVGMTLIVSCQQNGVLTPVDTDGTQSPYIEFNNYVNKLTRASKSYGNNSFVVGDTMAVWGEQTTGNIVDVIFNNQPVRFVQGTTWTYDNKKLWNVGSTYVFYGVYPYSKTLYNMSNDANRYITIPTYTTPNDTAKQVDLLISERRNISPLNTVDMIFHHILSNVNVYIKIGDGLETMNIDHVKLTSLKLYNIKSTGSYAQTGWNQNRAVGSWSNISGMMDLPTVTNLTLTKDPQAIYKDYLMIPQKLYSDDAQPLDVSIDATFRIFYKDQTTSTYVKNGIRLAGISGTNGTSSMILTHWEPNYRYNYTLAFNPQKTTRIWDADGDGSIQIDPATGDTITKTDDTPFPGTMRYNPDEPEFIYIYEDTDNDKIPDTWKKYPIAWEDVDGDGFLEAGIDRNNDGHIDNVDGETDSQYTIPGNTTNVPSDGNPNNPEGKDVILVHYDSNDDGIVDDNDLWSQIEKDPTTGAIHPAREEEDLTIEFTATVSEWEQTYSVDYSIKR